VKAVVEILMNLLNAGNEIDSISVLTNYEAQEHKIRNEVNSQAKVAIFHYL
jgi:seryl-tRNA synthetase